MEMSLYGGGNEIDLMAAAPASAPTKRQLSPEELAELKPIIEQMYIEERKTFPQVKSFLLAQYNFEPTKRQFYGMINKWGFKKNTKQGERESILSNLHAGGNSRVGAVTLNKKKLNRWKREVAVAAPKPRVTITQQPGSPRVFQMSETLFSRLSVYLTGSYEHGTWLSVDGQVVMNIRNGESRAPILDNFLGSCLSAVNLLNAESYVDARKVLSGACGQLREIIETEDPLTLHYFMETFSNMLRNKTPALVQVVDIIRRYIGKMAMTVIAKDHPWRDICCLLGTIESEQLEGAILQTFNCIATVFGEKLGPLHTNTFAARLECVKIKYIGYLPGAELAMRGFLDECKKEEEADPRYVGGVSIPQTLQVMSSLTFNLISQGRLEEAEKLALDYYERSVASNDTTSTVRALLLTARAQHRQGKNDLAVYYQRAAVTLNVELGKEYLIWAVAHLTELEKWYREWGRIEEADAAWLEIKGLVDSENAEEDLVEEITEN